jgi:hypothetical protein
MGSRDGFSDDRGVYVTKSKMITGDIFDGIPDLHVMTEHCFPVIVLFPATKKAWRAMIKVLGCDDDLPKSAGSITQFTRDQTPDVLVLSMSESCKEQAADAIIGLMAHECLHIVQMTERAMGARMDDETSAYFLQKLVMWANASFAASGRKYKK